MANCLNPPQQQTDFKIQMQQKTNSKKPSPSVTRAQLEEQILAETKRGEGLKADVITKRAQLQKLREQVIGDGDKEVAGLVGQYVEEQLSAHKMRHCLQSQISALTQYTTHKSSQINLTKTKLSSNRLPVPTLSEYQQKSKQIQQLRTRIEIVEQSLEMLDPFSCDELLEDELVEVQEELAKVIRVGQNLDADKDVLVGREEVIRNTVVVEIGRVERFVKQEQDLILNLKSLERHAGQIKERIEDMKTRKTAQIQNGSMLHEKSSSQPKSSSKADRKGNSCKKQAKTQKKQKIRSNNPKKLSIIKKQIPNQTASNHTSQTQQPNSPSELIILISEIEALQQQEQQIDEEIAMLQKQKEECKGVIEDWEQCRKGRKKKGCAKRGKELQDKIQNERNGLEERNQTKNVLVENIQALQEYLYNLISETKQLQEKHEHWKNSTATNTADQPKQQQSCMVNCKQSDKAGEVEISPQQKTPILTNNPILKSTATTTSLPTKNPGKKKQKSTVMRQIVSTISGSGGLKNRRNNQVGQSKIQFINDSLFFIIFIFVAFTIVIIYI